MGKDNISTTFNAVVKGEIKMIRDYLKFYVLRNDMNTDKPYMYNVFNNVHVHEHSIDLIEKFKDNKITKQEFKDELDRIVRWQEWSRFEYEIAVCPLLDVSEETATKIDCYYQFEANLDMFVDYIELLIKDGRI